MMRDCDSMNKDSSRMTNHQDPREDYYTVIADLCGAASALKDGNAVARI